MNTRNVTNTAFTSYPATRVELPNGRRLANSYDVLYRRTLVRDVTNGVNVAAWQFFGPSRVAEVNLANGLTCAWMNNARTNSAVQPSVANPAWGDQSSDRLGYDGAGRPITKRYLAGGLNGSNGYANPSAVVGFTTEYDLASNKFYERALHAPARSSLYEPFSNGSPTGGYDSINRLRQYQRGVLTSDDGFAGNGGGSVVSGSSIALPGTDTQRTYDLDSLGNWRRTIYTPEGGSQQTEVRQHNALNEITRIQNASSQINLLYDGALGASNGNLANDGTRSYAWDALNRLIEVKRVSDGAVIGQYVYDALNRRIRKTIPDLGGNLGGLTGNIPAGTTDCIYSGWRCVEERNPFGESGDTPTIQYVWGIYLDELLQIYAYADFGSQPLSPGAYYPLQDLLYRTTALANSSGAILEVYDTDAYGNTLIFSAPGTAGNWWADNAASAAYPACPFIYTGQRFDPETEIYYYKRRYYVPQWGRFVSTDPGGAWWVSGRYCYVRSRPSGGVDPRGMQSIILWAEPAPFMPVEPVEQFVPRLYVPPPEEPVLPEPQPAPGPAPGPIDVAPLAPRPGPNEPRPRGPNPCDYPADRPFKKPWKCPSRSSNQPDSDCSQGQLQSLNWAVNSLCPDHGVIDFPECTEIYSTFWSCSAIEDLKNKWDSCCSQRRKRENNCFRGGDYGHRVALARCEFQVSYCYYLLRYWECAGYKPGPVVGGYPGPIT